MYDAYLICTTPRSGSTMLCDLLRQTGVAGAPESYFRPGSVAAFCAGFGLPPQDGHSYDAAYITAALSAARIHGPPLGLRFMWDAMPVFEARLRACYGTQDTGAALLSGALGRTRYIFLERGDKVAQAVSRARAEQTGLWHRNADGSVREQTGPRRAPRYDRSLIETFLEEQAQDITLWSEWFAQNGITPYPIRYEDLARAPQDTVAALLTDLGLDPSRAYALAPGTAKLADGTSQEWADRFRNHI